MHITRFRPSWFVAGVASSLAVTAGALEPPTREQLERYRRDGSLATRIATAEALGNHRLAPGVGPGSRAPHADGKATAATSGLLPARGTPRVFALLVSFSDHPGFTDPAVVDDRLFGDGDPAAHPYESLRGFYLRSSYGALDIDGTTLGWYRTPYPRSEIGESAAGREALIAEAITAFDDQGHDFAPYDNDGDGVIDYFLVIWTGPHGEWAEFWWGYLTSFGPDNPFRVDGKQLGRYSWQWEAWDAPGPFDPKVAIHETGHALGLPDYYDYDDSVGPRGGVGGLDQMAGNLGDHNSFSKWLLGWADPVRIHRLAHDVVLAPHDLEPSPVVAMHGDPPPDPYGEYFLIEHRRRAGNDAELPADGLLIWHVDARLSPEGGFLYDNSTTEHKLLRLMEADGLEQIERGRSADAGDFYRDGDSLGTDTTPSSHRYDGAPTNLELSGIVTMDHGVGLHASLGSGCAIFCSAAIPVTAWPGVPVPVDVGFYTEGCGAAAVTVDLDLGDGASGLAIPTSHVYWLAGEYAWSLELTSGDGWCGRSGVTMACDDLRCRQWSGSAPMTRPRAFHLSVATAGGVLVVGGGGWPEWYDPVEERWSPTARPNEVYVDPSLVVIDDGRVLMTGLTAFGTVKAEVYERASDSWTVVATPLEAGAGGTAVRLADGRVLAAGGMDPGGGGPVLVTGLYDPVLDRWSPAGELEVGIESGASVALPSGGALLVGDDGPVQRFDPSVPGWRRLGDLTFERQLPAVVGLADGRVMVLGGLATRWAMVFDPATERWTIGGRLDRPRAAATAVTLGSGHVLVAGGFDDRGTVLATSELWDPATGRWTRVGSMEQPRAVHSSVRLPSGGVMVMGGYRALSGTDQVTPTVELFSAPVVPPRRPGGRP